MQINRNKAAIAWVVAAVIAGGILGAHMNEIVKMVEDLPKWALLAGFYAVMFGAVMGAIVTAEDE